MDDIATADLAEMADYESFVAMDAPIDRTLSERVDQVVEKIDGSKIDNTPKPDSILDDLIRLSVTNRIEEMKANLENDYFILHELALAGQITLFYAWPNTGKTLLFLTLLIQSIKAGRLKAEDLFYINADDNYKGLYTKGRIAQQHGFHMISPAEANTSPKVVLAMLDALASTEAIKGKVIVMDTLKKFVDMMSKRDQAALYEVLRRLVTKGATVIIAGHANKHSDVDGNLVYEGTADTLNDIDCCFSMYRMTEQDAERQVVEFRREKDRGEVIAKVSYEYTRQPGDSYTDIINSVKRLDESQAEQAALEQRASDLKGDFESEILFVTGLLSKGPLSQSEILKRHKSSDDPLAGGSESAGCA
ncbi:MAG: hypothetical protein RPU59_07750 [Candidatus Sedimenticola sp. (ex Thyasira tokunagai)]